MSVDPLRHRLSTEGFVRLQGVFSPAHLADIDALLNAGLAAHPAPVRDRWGTELVPLYDHAPEMARHLEGAPLLEALAPVLGGPVVQLQAAARFTGLGDGGFLPWHFHAPGAGGDGRWDPDRPGAPTGIEAVIVCAYADGASPERGPVWLLPRGVTDPYTPPSLDRTARWPGTREQLLDPGDVLVFTLPSYHAAWCHKGPRRIFGGVYARADGAPCA